jgi:hypothetical protein
MALAQYQQSRAAFAEFSEELACNFERERNAAYT